MIRFLKLPRWHDILMEIYKSSEKDIYVQRLNRRVNASLTHVRSIIRLLAKHRLIEIIPNRKTKKLVLTEKGRKISISIFDIKTALYSD